MWRDCIYCVTVLIYCCVLTVYNALYNYLHSGTLWTLHWNKRIRGQSIEKPNNFFLNLLLHLRLNQTRHLQSTPLHSWYTAPKVFPISGTRPGTCFAGQREGPLSNFLLSPIPSEIGDILVRISTSGTRKSLQGPNMESGAAGGQQSSRASSKIHG